MGSTCEVVGAWGHRSGRRAKYAAAACGAPRCEKPGLADGKAHIAGQLRDALDGAHKQAQARAVVAGVVGHNPTFNTHRPLTTDVGGLGHGGAAHLSGCETETGGRDKRAEPAKDVSCRHGPAICALAGPAGKGDGRRDAEREQRWTNPPGRIGRRSEPQGGPGNHADGKPQDPTIALQGHHGCQGATRRKRGRRATTRAF
jgi:hypothetical protein